MTIKQWIQKTGAKKVATLCGVDVSTVFIWKSLGACPKPKHLVKVNQLSGGKVSIEKTIREFVKKSRGN